MTIQLQDNGIIKPPTGSCTNFLDIGSRATDALMIVGSTVMILGTLVVGSTGAALPAGSSAATNTTITIPGTTAGALLFDTKANGSLGTVAYTFNDLVRALKVAGVIAQ